MRMFWGNMSDWLILLPEIKALMFSIGKMNSVGVVPAARCVVASFAAEVAVDAVVVEVVLPLSGLSFSFVVVALAFPVVVVSLLHLDVVVVPLVALLFVVLAFLSLGFVVVVVVVVVVVPRVVVAIVAVVIVVAVLVVFVAVGLWFALSFLLFFSLAFLDVVDILDGCDVSILRHPH